MEKSNRSSKYKWNSVKTKLIAGMTAVAIIPTISIAVVSNAITQNVIGKQYGQATLQVTKQASDSLDYKIQGVVSQISLLSNNVDFKQFYQNPENAKYGNFLLNDTLNTNNEYLNVYFATTKNQMVLAPASQLPPGIDWTSRVWYKGAVNNDGKPFYSPPYKDAVTNKLVLTISQAVKDDSGNLVGVIGIDLSMDNFSKSMKSIQIGKNGYMTIIGNDGNYIYNPDSKKIGSALPTNLALADDLKKQNEGNSEYQLNGVDKFSSFTTNNRTGWKFISVLDKSEITNDANYIRNIGWLLTIVFGVLSAVCAYFLGKRISRNITTVKDALETASHGDFTARVSVNTNDEFKELEQSFNDTMEQLSASLRKVGVTSKTVLDTSAHLSIMTKETNAALSEVALAIEEIAQGANLQARNVQTSSDQMRNLSNQLDDVSDSTEEMNTVSDRSMELSGKGLERIVLLSEKSNETKTTTSEVASIVNEVDVRMEEINSIIDVITKITDQTNLLSLNASIESARAGEHGRGFAVVANEVRNLAEQSRASAVEIKRIVDSIKLVVKNAVNAMERTNKAVHEQEDAVSETKSIFNDILSAVRDLGQKVADVETSIKGSHSNKEVVSQEIESIIAVSQQTAAATEEVSASTEEISATMNSFTQHSNGLKELSEQLDNEIKKFKLGE
ncbi:methyl-accepting chemotaxis protein [Bacillus sp. BRMEA1]|uniref:methyl-accepting chemotaxis protein n=1 Tax=Neobacillus endophyticus TaxID=2738405 RepID=UPI0015663168|nr:methyl-accepting chemotaxis protein [Neobacillus endophyticus]NRD79394.1 methyl-accepting chemotaxis protein [Neobacillus endophyticus]